MKTAITVAFVALGLLVTTALCQDPAVSPKGPGVTVSPRFAQPAPVTQTVAGQTQTVAPPQRTHTTSFGTLYSPGSQTAYFGLRSQHNATRAAMQNLKQAKNEDEKSAAKDELQDALESEYDASLDAYEEHLEEMEKKISELREQLKRRRRAKDEMVQLRLQMLIHEADGLGWPDKSIGNLNSPFFRPLSVPTVPASPASPIARPPSGRSR